MLRVENKDFSWDYHTNLLSNTKFHVNCEKIHMNRAIHIVVQENYL